MPARQPEDGGPGAEGRGTYTSHVDEGVGERPHGGRVVRVAANAGVDAPRPFSRTILPSIESRPKEAEQNEDSDPTAPNYDRLATHGKEFKRLR